MRRRLRACVPRDPKVIEQYRKRQSLSRALTLSHVIGRSVPFSLSCACVRACLCVSACLRVCACLYVCVRARARLCVCARARIERRRRAARARRGTAVPPRRRDAGPGGRARPSTTDHQRLPSIRVGESPPARRWSGGRLGLLRAGPRGVVRGGPRGNAPPLGETCRLGEACRLEETCRLDPTVRDIDSEELTRTQPRPPGGGGGLLRRVLPAAGSVGSRGKPGTGPDTGPGRATRRT